jgi:dipeptidyl aminopeptidase/acylaminoacyl peptidase
MHLRLTATAYLLAVAPALASEPVRRVVNDGQLILEGIPEIPMELADSLNRFQQVRSNAFVEWAENHDSIYVRTRFGDVNQLHAVEEPGGELRQLTHSDEPVREVRREISGHRLAFTKDHGGSAFDQIYLLDPRNGETSLLTDGESLNNRMVWDKSGQRLAYRSTRRNGRSNDIWIMDVEHPEQARIVWEAQDGALWKPVSFNRNGKLLLIQQYSGVVDSRIHLLNLESGAMRELVGHPDYETSNVAIDFDRKDKGIFFVSNQRGRAAEIGWAPLDASQVHRWVPNHVSWDITEFELSPDGKRGAFVTNEDGISRLYLFDARRMNYRPYSNLPIGVVNDLRFSPNSRNLGFTLSTPVNPAEAYSVEVGFFSNTASRMTRWTTSKVGGLDTGDFVVPKLFRFKAPGIEEDRPFHIPGFAYLPKGDGPFPVVIWVHGGPESQFRPSFNSVVQMWVTQLGVAVLAPNVRGSLGYGKSWLSLDDGRLREDSVRDIGALLDYIEEVPELDASRVAVFGASYGGYMALASAVHYSDRLVAAVDRAGISNFVTYLENTQGYRRDLRRYEYGDERDPEMRAFLESISPLNNVDKIDIPLLIVQGQNDPVVPVTESSQMVQALRDRGQTVWYMNALNEGHGYEKKENRDIYQQVTFMFLKKFLLGQ